MSREPQTLDYETPSGPKGPDGWARLSVGMAIVSMLTFFFGPMIVLVFVSGTAGKDLLNVVLISVLGLALVGAISGIVSIARRGPSVWAIVGLVVNAFFVLNAIS